jgi:hypothetical protein
LYVLITVMGLYCGLHDSFWIFSLCEAVNHSSDLQFLNQQCGLDDEKPVLLVLALPPG